MIPLLTSISWAQSLTNPRQSTYKINCFTITKNEIDKYFKKKYNEDPRIVLLDKKYDLFTLYLSEESWTLTIQNPNNPSLVCSFGGGDYYKFNKPINGNPL